jgi:hypothetical protein
MTDVTSEITVPILGQAGEPCRECGAPLAEDQRYCLACGARRGAPRVELGRAAPPPAPAPPEPRRPRRAGGATAIAGVATLLLAMGVGVLIGRAGRADTTRASAPAQVISVSGGGAPSGAAATTTGGETSSPATARRHHKAKHAKARHASGSSGVKGGSKASNPTVQKLSKLSPKEYQKQSQKLPKTVGTGGKPPPKDNKKPAGGGGFEEIG